jgi:hypothetical protein
VSEVPDCSESEPEPERSPGWEEERKLPETAWWRGKPRSERGTSGVMAGGTETGTWENYHRLVVVAAAAVVAVAVAVVAAAAVVVAVVAAAAVAAVVVVGVERRGCLVVKKMACQGEAASCHDLTFAVAAAGAGFLLCDASGPCSRPAVAAVAVVVVVKRNDHLVSAPPC